MKMKEKRGNSIHNVIEKGVYAFPRNILIVTFKNCPSYIRVSEVKRIFGCRQYKFLKIILKSAVCENIMCILLSYELNESTTVTDTDI